MARHTHVVRESADVKLTSRMHAPVAVTYRNIEETCDNSCPLKDLVCYGQRGHVNLWQNRAVERNDPISKATGIPYYRYDVAGDCLQEDGEVDREYIEEMKEHHIKYPDVIGWKYTHSADKLQEAGYGPETWPENLSVLASCDDIASATRLQGLGWRTARTVAAPEDAADNEVLCPYDVQKYEGRKSPDTNCVKCGLCLRTQVNIAFVIH